jgi:hypothetical protein
VRNFLLGLLVGGTGVWYVNEAYKAPINIEIKINKEANPSW